MFPTKREGEEKKKKTGDAPSWGRWTLSGTVYTRQPVQECLCGAPESRRTSGRGPLHINAACIHHPLRSASVLQSGSIYAGQRSTF